MKDRELQDLLSAGRPHIRVPSPRTVSRDIKESFEVCRERIGILLCVRVVYSLNFRKKNLILVIFVGTSWKAPFLH